MNRLLFSGAFLAGSLWGTGIYFLLSKKDHEKGFKEATSEDDLNLKTQQQILKYGAPTRSPEISHYKGHVLCYDQEKKIPRWVAEDITAFKVKGVANRKHSKFHPDLTLPEQFRSHNSDFWKSGWSRGHMAPAGNYKYDQVAMNETFLLSNILPQDINNNGGFWNRFEMYCRELTNTYGHVRVISGPVMLPNVQEDGKQFVKYQLVGKNHVAVPTHLYKVIVAEDDGTSTPPLLGAFIVPNEPIDYSHKLTEYQVPLEELEKKAGLIFVPTLDRTTTSDLCTVDGCKLMERDQFELYFIGRRMQSAKTLESLEKVWGEIERKRLQPDDYAKELYAKKKSELQKNTDELNSK